MCVHVYIKIFTWSIKQTKIWCQCSIMTTSLLKTDNFLSPLSEPSNQHPSLFLSSVHPQQRQPPYTTRMHGPPQSHHQPRLSVLPASPLCFPSSFPGSEGFPGGSDGKESTCTVGDLGSTPGWEDPLEKGMATHSSILAWRIPWTV